MKRLIASLLLSAAMCGPVSAAISVTVPGSSSIAGSGTTITRSGITIPANATGIVGGMLRKNGAGDTYSIADGNGNNYTIVECAAAGAANPMFIAYFNYGGTGLSAGNIVLTASVATTAGTFQVMYATGVKVTSPEDASTRACNQTATTTSPTITSGTPSEANELFLNVIGKNSTSVGFSDTEDTGNGWTGNFGTGSTAIVSVMAYQVNGAATTKVHNPTMAPSATWTQQIIGLKQEPPSSVLDGGLTTLGAGN